MLKEIRKRNRNNAFLIFPYKLIIFDESFYSLII